MADDARDAYEERIRAVTDIRGFVALWDFVEREDGAAGVGPFLARTPSGRGYPLEARNIIRAFWRQGREATYADFPLLGSGLFGQAVRFEEEEKTDFLPTLLVPRERLHDSRLDVKGPGGSVSMVVWVRFYKGNHALAGIWHEGTDITSEEDRAAVVEKGKRQYAAFAGLAANPGASAVHVSENGGSSFSDKYARNLAVTPDLIPKGQWAAVGFVFDNSGNTATAYLNGRAREYWIEEPAEHPFYQWAAKGWRQAQAGGLDPGYPPDQRYQPPEDEPLQETVVRETERERVVVRTYAFTKVRESYRADGQGGWAPAGRELVGLKVNPFYFGHDLYAPRTPEDGGPFTIGRVIKSSRGEGNAADYGGVAVFDRALTAEEMRALAVITEREPLRLQDLIRGAGKP